MKIDIIKTINPKGKLIQAATERADYFAMLDDMKALGLISTDEANEMFVRGTFYDYAERVGYRFERLEGIISHDDPH